MKTKAMARTGRTRKTTANSDAAARPPLAMAPAAAQFRPCKEGIRSRGYWVYGMRGPQNSLAQAKAWLQLQRPFFVFFFGMCSSRFDFAGNASNRNRNCRIGVQPVSKEKQSTSPCTTHRLDQIPRQ